MSERRPDVTAADWLLTLVAVALFGLFFATTQQQIDGGVGNDGGNYLETASQLQSGSRIEGAAPFVWRLGTPLLAAFLADVGGVSLQRAFLVFNLAAGVLAALLFVLWLRPHVTDAATRAILAVVFLAAPYSPFRFTFHYPVLTDPAAMVWLLLALLTLDWWHQRPEAKRVWLVAAVVAAGCVFREVLLVIAVGALFMRPWPRRRGDWLLRFVPLMTGLVTLVLVRQLAHAGVSNYSALATVLYWLKWKTAAQLLVALLFVFGPAVIVLLPSWRATIRVLALRCEFAACLIALFALAWLGGSDTERILEFATPIVLMYVGRSLVTIRRSHSYFAMATIVGLQLAAYRVLLPIGGAVPRGLSELVGDRVTGLLATLTVYESFFSLSLSRSGLVAALTAHAVAMLLIAGTAWRAFKMNMPGTPARIKL